MNWLLLRNSLVVSSLTTLLAVSLGFVASIWLAGLSRPWRTRILTVAIIALAWPPFLVTNCWLDLLGQTGLWRRWLPLNIASLTGAIWIMSLLLWPITLFLVSASWQRLETAQVESDMAVRGGTLIRALLLPLARSSLGQAVVLTFVLALNNFAVPAILQVKVFPAEMWVRFSTNFDTFGALKLSWPLVLAPLLLIAWRSQKEFAWPRLEGPAAATLIQRQLRRTWFWFCGAATLTVCILSVGVPLFQIANVKRTWTEWPDAVAASPSAIWHSFYFAAAAGVLVIVGALIGTLWISEKKGVKSVALLFGLLVWIPFLVPGVLLGILLIATLNRSLLSWLYQSAGIVVLAFLLRYFAVGWHGVRHALQTVDRDLIDDARLNGASRWQILHYVQWPQISRAIATTGYIIFLLSLWDVESLILILPPGGETLALRIFNLLHYGHNAQVNALCLTLVLLALAPLLVWWLARSYFSGNSNRLASGLLILGVTGFLALSGCSPSSDSNQTILSSQIFSHAQVIGSRGVGLGQLNKPRSVAVDRQDNLYVVDMTGRVQKFSPKGDFLISWQMPQTDLGKPKGMCRDREGSIIVVEPHYQRVNHFSPEGKLIAQWGEKGTNVGQFMLPRAVAVNSEGEIYVSEYGAVERVQRFGFADDPKGSARQSLARHVHSDQQAGTLSTHTAYLSEERPTQVFLNVFGHPGNGPGEFNRPEGLCVDSQDNVHVADSCNHRIQIFSRQGKFIRSFGKAGSGKGELSYPYDVCVDASGRQYVCEFGNSRIQVFDASDRSIEIIGGPGAAPGQFSNPWGIALDSNGNLYVADSQNHRVQKLIRRQTMAGRDLPTSKLQHPGKSEAPNFMTRLPDPVMWSLEFGACLIVGCWSLDVFSTANPNP